MKLFVKITATLLTAIALLVLNPTAKATDGKTVSVTTQMDANCLTVTVSMDETTVTSLGVAVAFDNGMQLASTKWIPEGLMANFDASKNKGVFSTGTNAAKISGDVFQMVLTAQDMENYHEITVTLIGKNDTVTVFNETITLSFGEKKIIYGDANRDGVVTIADATAIKSYRVGLIDESELDLSACDLDGNGVVDVYDACLIQYYLHGDMDVFPVQNANSVNN